MSALPQEVIDEIFNSFNDLPDGPIAAGITYLRPARSGQTNLTYGKTLTPFVPISDVLC